MISINTLLQETKKQHSRLIFIDILKTIAIFGVLIIHLTPKAFEEYTPYSFNYIFTVFLNCFVRFSVPVFIMCSGALFLSENKVVSVKSIYSKYIPRIVIALFLFAAVYEVIGIYCSYLDTGVWDTAFFLRAKKNILSFNTHFHLYYLYIMVIVYALTPPIKLFLSAAKKMDVEYVIVFLFITSMLIPFLRNFYPFDRYYGGMALQYSLNLTYSLLTYFVLGYYLNKYPLKGRKLLIVTILGIISVFITFICTTNSLFAKEHFSEIYLQGTSPTVFFMAVALFSCVKNYSENIGENSLIAKISVYMSNASFTVYLVHECFNILFERNNFTLLSFSPVFSLPLMIVLNLFLSLLVNFVLRKIPGIRKIL